jgi:hypothetical protein
MKCLICNNESIFFIKKTSFKVEYQEMVKDFSGFTYYKCTKCGFTISKTHMEMPNDLWLKLNYDFHHFIENNTAPINQPPYLEQAMIINVLNSNGIVSFKNAIDFAGGYGTLSKILYNYHKITLPIYDPYVTTENEGVIYINKKKLSKYNTLLNSALFEHLFTRNSFDEINDLIEDNGCMILHTVVCDNIPSDEKWFYMEPPVHCAFHTNYSMEILMSQWGFVSSIYCPSAKFWVLFKKEPENLNNKIDLINKEFQKEVIIYKKGFVDYWKGF